MPRPHSHIDILQLHRYLEIAIWHGARGPRLVAHVPELVELLYPTERFPDTSDQDRALCVQHDIRHVLDTDIGGPAADALAALLGLRVGTTGRKIGDRRRIAGEQLNVDAETFRRPHYETALLLDLAAALCEYYGHTATD